MRPPKPQKMRNFRWPNCAAIYDLTPEAEERLRGEERNPSGWSIPHGYGRDEASAAHMRKDRCTSELRSMHFGNLQSEERRFQHILLISDQCSFLSTQCLTVTRAERKGADSRGSSMLQEGSGVQPLVRVLTFVNNNLPNAASTTDAEKVSLDH